MNLFYFIFVALGNETGASHGLVKHSTTKEKPSTRFTLYFETESHFSGWPLASFEAQAGTHLETLLP